MRSFAQPTKLCSDVGMRTEKKRTVWNCGTETVKDSNGTIRPALLKPTSSARLSPKTTTAYHNGELENG